MVEYSDMRKDDLVAEADMRGLNNADMMKKAEIVELLEQHDSGELEAQATDGADWPEPTAEDATQNLYMGLGIALEAVRSQKIQSGGNPAFNTSIEFLQGEVSRLWDQLVEESGG